MQIVMAVPVRVLHYLRHCRRKVASTFLLWPETFLSVYNTQLHIKIKTIIFDRSMVSSELNGVVFNLCLAMSASLCTGFKYGSRSLLVI